MKTESKKILAALDNARRVVGRRNTLPVLSCVKIYAKHGVLKIESTDLDQHQIEQVECDGELEPCCVSLEYLVSAIGGESVRLELKNKVLNVVCSFGETRLKTLDADEFPKQPKQTKPVKQGVACADLSKAVKSVVWAASKDDSRYILKSVFVESDSKSLKVCATNGRDLVFTSLPLISSKFDMVIPSEFSSNVCHWLEAENATLINSENLISVESPSGLYMCKKLEGNYPNYRQVIPDKKKLLGSVSTEEFSGVLARCVAFFKTSLEAKGVFNFSADGMTIDLRGENEAEITYKIDGKFEPFKIALNCKSMVQIIQNSKTDEVKLFHSGDEFSPARIESGDFVTITMPTRLY